MDDQGSLWPEQTKAWRVGKLQEYPPDDDYICAFGVKYAIDKHQDFFGVHRAIEDVPQAELDMWSDALYEAYLCGLEHGIRHGRDRALISIKERAKERIKQGEEYTQRRKHG